MNRIEVNVQTGEIKTIPLTQAEMDAAAVRVAAEAALPKPKSKAELMAAIDAASTVPQLRAAVKEALGG